MVYEKERNYGLYIGDRVRRGYFGFNDEVTVQAFILSDNNACVIEDGNGDRSEAVCEWLNRIPPPGYLNFYPVPGRLYTVVMEYVNRPYPTISSISGDDLYERVGRAIYNYRVLFGEVERLQRVMIYLEENEGDLDLMLYQAIDDEDSFAKTIEAYKKLKNIAD